MSYRKGTLRLAVTAITFIRRGCQRGVLRGGVGLERFGGGEAEFGGGGGGVDTHIPALLLFKLTPAPPQVPRPSDPGSGANRPSPLVTRCAICHPARRPLHSLYLSLHRERPASPPGS